MPQDRTRAMNSRVGILAFNSSILESELVNCKIEINTPD
jgi:hypothetical protein